FEQIKKDDYSQNGTGLGLSITKELISLMGGNIYVKSFIGIGSEFYFSIDYECGNENEIIKGNNSKELIGIEYQNLEKSILVVDDIKENRDLVLQILSQYGFKIYEASSGYEAIDILKIEKIDFIFMDILMNGLDGIETIKIIRENSNQKDIPIIAISANVFEEDKQKVLKAGATDFIPKPVEEKQILLSLQKYLNVKPTYDEILNYKQIEHKLFENISNDFFEKLNSFAIQMDNILIEKLIEEYALAENDKNYIIDLIEDFDYQQITKICEMKEKKE
uniref:ATP-binding response regulator n=1 Tax=Arcobacter sp. s6 TaxID=3230363 RepID=UPI00349FD8A9